MAVDARAGAAVKRVVIDTDLAMGAPGADIDDGFALALALASPDLQVDLVTTVAGNTDVESATLLTQRLLALLGREVPVVRGAARPLRRPRTQPPAAITRVAGDPPAAPGRAASALVDAVLAAPGEVTVVAIGPLTNLALAVALEPAFATAVAEVVVMGGVFTGQTHWHAMAGEFNTWSDPEAAAAVLASGAALRFVGLDVTRQVRLTRAQATALRDRGTPFGRLAGQTALDWVDALAQLRRVPQDADSCAMHDPLAVAVVSRPELVTWRPARVAVEVAGELTRGVVVTEFPDEDPPGSGRPAANCRIGVAVDAAAASEHVLRGVRDL